MADYLEVVQFKQRGDKWRAQRLGYAKKNDKGALNVYLDALPIPDHEGQVRLTIQKQQERNGGGTQPSSPDGVYDQTAPAGGVVLEDDVPFGPEVR